MEEDWDNFEDQPSNSYANTTTYESQQKTSSGWGDWGVESKTGAATTTSETLANNGFTLSTESYSNGGYKNSKPQDNGWGDETNSYYSNSKRADTIQPQSQGDSGWGDWDGRDPSKTATTTSCQNADDRKFSENTRSDWNDGHSNSANGNYGKQAGYSNRRENIGYGDDNNDQWNSNERKGDGFLSKRNDSEYTRRTKSNFGGERNRDNFGDFQDKVDDENYVERQPITYEPAYLNYDEEQLFEKKHDGGGINFSDYDKIDVEMTGGDGSTLDRISTFDQCNLHPQIHANVKRCNYVHPTPIQKSVIPIITKTQHDIMACAQTGSGKTAAFLLPIFSKMLSENDHTRTSNYVPSPTVLLIGPTRELVNQLFMEMQKFSWGTGINCARVYGGVSRNFLLKGLNNNCHVLSATPGRLLAFLKNGEVSLEQVKYLILDEADRMLDMGFIGDIKRIVNDYGLVGKNSRRCYMFSATFPPDVQKLAADILNPNFYFITVGMVGGAADSISQSLEMLPITKKRERLVEILGELSSGTKALVFVETKRQADYLTIYLCESGFNAISIHGDRLQQQREQALASFINGAAPILVATSVAARGLDIPSVDLVINYDMPHEVDEYVHRIGRTGRIGNRGLAISFFQENRDEPLAGDLLKILNNANQEAPEWLTLLAGASLGNPGASKGNYIHRQRDVRYGDQSNDQLYHQKFNAMDSHPYANNATKKFNTNNAPSWQDTQNNTGNQEAKQNDDEYW